MGDKHCGGCLYQFRNEDGAYCQIHGIYLISDGVDYIRFHKCKKEGSKDTVGV